LPQCAANVSNGSFADIGARNKEVRFTPGSRHQLL